MTKRKNINTHLGLEGRTIIESRLNEGKKVTEISNELTRDRSNIGREILKHRKPVFPSSFNNSNPCASIKTCNKSFFECYKCCKDFVELNPCEKLMQSPYVCNGCTIKNGCRHIKYYYSGTEANNEYLATLVNSRKGNHYTELEISILNNDFTNLVRINKSVYHSLIVINKRGFDFKLANIYRLIGNNELELKSSDLPRNNRKTKKSEKIDKSYKRDITNHSFEDYEKYKTDNPDAIEMQMDTVEGIKDGRDPVLLTFEIVKIKFFMAFLIEKQTQEKVILKLREQKNILMEELFNSLFEILLTDNGKEFSNPELFRDISEEINVFYCHPYSSFEKGSIENTHELVRRVIPKGISLNIYTQDDINTLCNHINSLFRKELGGKCPFELIEDYIPSGILYKMKYSRVDESNVMLIPELLGEKNINNIKKYLTSDMIKKQNITINS